VRYNRQLATVSPEEFAELMAIVYSEPAPTRPLTADDHWRRAYQRDQQSKRVLGSQADLFNGRTITHYRRHRPAPEVEAPDMETIEAKLERTKDDPFAAYDRSERIGPHTFQRSKRPRSSRGQRTGSGSGNGSASLMHREP
jgi:hypothetical protein